VRFKNSAASINDSEICEDDIDAGSVEGGGGVLGTFSHVLVFNEMIDGAEPRGRNLRPGLPCFDQVAHVTAPIES